MQILWSDESSDESTEEQEMIGSFLFREIDIFGQYILKYLVLVTSSEEF